MALHLDREGAIKALQERGLDPTSIVEIVHDYLIAPAAEKLATKAAERSARSRLRAKLDSAIDDIAAIKTSVTQLVDRVGRLEGQATRLDDRMGRLEDRVTRIETDVSTLKTDVAAIKQKLDDKPWKADLAEMENRLLLRFGAMLATGIGLLAVLQAVVK